VDETVGAGGGPAHRVRFKTNRELPPAAEAIESPYDADARYRHKRDTQWTGSMVHVSETCEPTAPHLLTPVQTTTAAVHEAMCTDAIEQARVEKNLPPPEHLVDAAYSSAELLVKSREAHGIVLRGPTRPSQGWQTQGDGAYRIDQFASDWDRQEAHCPQGKQAVSWTEQVDRAGKASVIVQFSRKDCRACPARAACTRAQHKARSLQLPPREQSEAIQATRAWYASEEGQRL
jgi:transposase